jgi:hypothetical protein
VAVVVGAEDEGVEVGAEVGVVCLAEVGVGVETAWVGVAGTIVAVPVGSVVGVTVVAATAVDVADAAAEVAATAVEVSAEAVETGVAAMAVEVATRAVAVAAPAVDAPVAVGTAVLTTTMGITGVDVAVEIVALPVDAGVGLPDDVHTGEETWLVSRVTAPVCAKALPCTVAPVVRVLLVRARILPVKAVPVPSVAELPTCQKALQLCAPLIGRTEALLEVVSVLPIWKMKTALGLPWPLSVSAPVNCADEEKQ